MWMCAFSALFLSLCTCCALEEQSTAEHGVCLSEDSSLCGRTHLASAMEFSEAATVAGEKLLLGRPPHRLSVADTSGIHLSLKTALKYHEERLPLVMLTWLQTVEPDQARQLPHSSISLSLDCGSELVSVSHNAPTVAGVYCNRRQCQR